MDMNSLRVANQEAGEWSCDQQDKISSRTPTSAGKVGYSVAVVDMNLM